MNPKTDSSTGFCCPLRMALLIQTRNSRNAVMRVFNISVSTRFHMSNNICTWSKLETEWFLQLWLFMMPCLQAKYLLSTKLCIKFQERYVLWTIVHARPCTLSDFQSQDWTGWNQRPRSSEEILFINGVHIFRKRWVGNRVHTVVFRFFMEMWSLTAFCFARTFARWGWRKCCVSYTILHFP